jgi:hypothetical protein
MKRVVQTISSVLLFDLFSTLLSFGQQTPSDSQITQITQKHLGSKTRSQNPLWASVSASLCYLRNLRIAWGGDGGSRLQSH